MMMIAAMILAALWLIGVATGSTGGGFIHLLLAGALAVVLIQFVQGWLACGGTPSGKRKS
jgi:hypothetical protein